MCLNGHREIKWPLQIIANGEWIFVLGLCAVLCLQSCERCAQPPSPRPNFDEGPAVSANPLTPSQLQFQSRQLSSTFTEDSCGYPMSPTAGPWPACWDASRPKASAGLPLPLLPLVGVCGFVVLVQKRKHGAIGQQWTWWVGRRTLGAPREGCMLLQSPAPVLDCVWPHPTYFELIRDMRVLG